MVPAVGSSWIFWRRKQKKVEKLRKNLFWRNGGHLLEDMLSGQRTLRIFTAEDLKKATDNYDENNVLGVQQHFGIAYKGIFPDGMNQIVTINTCDALYSCDVSVFISELVALSQINHRNVVKLLGCCLETQVPLLVYEFISVKTLYDYLDDDDDAVSFSWDIRLRIAAETAGALAYLHSAATVPIVHGNLNSSSILLDDGFTVKLHDFRVHCSLLTAGYVDPEYFQSGILTVNSDVYSFGVVLAELLIGRKMNSYERLEEEDVVQHFITSHSKDNLLRKLDHRLVTEGNIEQITEVAQLAERCLSFSSLSRPTMREVEIALESVRGRNSSSTSICPNSSQETTSRRVVRRNRSF